MFWWLDMLFPRAKGINNPFEYYPDSYFQDSSKSLITANRRYDPNNLSVHETDVVQSVLSTVSKKYPPKFRSAGLANESYVITYKPRYILFEIIIIKYQSSELPLDQFSVAFAYAMKGAQYRRKALEFFEKSIKEIRFSTLDRFASINSSFVFLKFAELYEREWEFDKSVFWIRQAIKRGGLNKKFLLAKIEEVNEKNKKFITGESKPRAKRKISDEDIKFEHDIHNTALRFIQEAVIWQKEKP